MSEPMTNPEDQKARECPLCDSAPIARKNENDGGIFRIRCSNVLCNMHQMWFPPAQWNTRPRERRLEKALMEAEEAIENCKTQIGICMGSCFLPEEVSSALSAINAALEEKR